MNRMELIDRLKRIIQLRDNAIRIKHRMNTFRPNDNYKRDVVLPPFPGQYGSLEEQNAWVTALAHEQDDAFAKMRAAHEEAYGPKMPVKPKQAAFKEPECSDLKEKKGKTGCLTTASAIVAGFFTLGALVNLRDEMVGTIILIAAIAGAIFAALRFREKSVDGEMNKRIAEARAEYLREGKVIDDEHNKNIAAYEEAHAAYLVKLDAFMEEYALWREVYVRYADEETHIADLLEKDRQAAVAQIESEEYIPAVTAFALGNNDLVPDSYFGLIEELLELVQAGRADSVKEAINLYEDIQFRERQMAMERETEERRRADEERRHREDMRLREEQERRRAADEERRHCEDMRQREAMERDRRREEDRHREEDRRRAERAERDRKSAEDAATRHQCNTCALAARCSMSFRRPNCASYRPR